MYSKSKEVLQNKVSQLRKSAGLTQAGLAEEAGVTRQTIIAIEKGDYVPSVMLAMKLAKCFKTSIEDVFYV